MKALKFFGCSRYGKPFVIAPTEIDRMKQWSDSGGWIELRIVDADVEADHSVFEYPQFPLKHSLCAKDKVKQ